MSTVFVKGLVLLSLLFGSFSWFGLKAQECRATIEVVDGFYQPLPDAAVECGGIEYKTNSFGKVEVPCDCSGNITVRKVSFLTQEVEFFGIEQSGLRRVELLSEDPFYSGYHQTDENEFGFLGVNNENEPASGRTYNNTESDIIREFHLGVGLPVVDSALFAFNVTDEACYSCDNRLAQKYVGGLMTHIAQNAYLKYRVLAAGLASEYKSYHVSVAIIKIESTQRSIKQLDGTMVKGFVCDLTITVLVSAEDGTLLFKEDISENYGKISDELSKMESDELSLEAIPHMSKYICARLSPRMFGLDDVTKINNKGIPRRITLEGDVSKVGSGTFTFYIVPSTMLNEDNWMNYRDAAIGFGNIQLGYGSDAEGRIKEGGEKLRVLIKENAAVSIIVDYISRPTGVDKFLKFFD